MTSYSRTWYNEPSGGTPVDADGLNDLEARITATASGGILLGSSSITSVFTTTSTTITDVTGLSVTVEVADRPIIVEMHADACTTGAASGAVLYLDEDGTTVGIMSVIPGGSISIPTDPRRQRLPSIDTHVYTIRCKNLSAGTLTVSAGPGTTTANSPATVRVLEI